MTPMRPAAAPNLTARLPGRWNLLALPLALGKIKDDNVVQAMQQDQVHPVDAWSYCQAKSIQEPLALTRAGKLRLLMLIAGFSGWGLPPMRWWPCRAEPPRAGAHSRRCARHGNSARSRRPRSRSTSATTMPSPSVRCAITSPQGSTTRL